MRRILPAATLGAFFLLPQTAWAIQAHGAPEGIVTHQIAHLIFTVAMGILIYWLQERRLVEESGWRLIQYAAFFFVLWNLDTFFAHLVDEQLLLVQVEKIDFWHWKIVPKDGFSLLAPIYYLAKMDHLLCVPAMLFLYLGLRRLLKTQAAEPREGGST